MDISPDSSSFLWVLAGTRGVKSITKFQILGAYSTPEKATEASEIIRKEFNTVIIYRVKADSEPEHFIKPTPRPKTPPLSLEELKTLEIEGKISKKTYWRKSRQARRHR